MFLISYLFLFSLVAATSCLNIYHRVSLPGVSPTDFVLRGVVDSTWSSSPLSFQPSTVLSQHWAQFTNILRDAQTQRNVDLDRALYQIALEREGGEWDISSVKLCHLPFVSSETMVLHILDFLQAPSPYAIDYFVSPVPHDGSCPKMANNSVSSEASLSALNASAINLDSINTTVSLAYARLPPLPQLRTPPPLTAEGEPVKPAPEKSFIQKYWMYIAAVLVALLMAGGGPEEEGQSGPKR